MREIYYKVDGQSKYYETADEAANACLPIPYFTGGCIHVREYYACYSSKMEWLGYELGQRTHTYKIYRDKLNNVRLYAQGDTLPEELQK